MKRFVASADSETDENIWETVEAAYVYTFPLVLMDADLGNEYRGICYRKSTCKSVYTQCCTGRCTIQDCGDS